MLRIIGVVLFSLGIIATLISAAKLPTPGQQWSNMLSAYFLAVALTLMGLLLLHWLPKKEKEQQCQLAMKKCFYILELLQELVMAMRQFSEEMNELDGDNIATKVDELLNKYVVSFTEEKQQIFFQLGHSQGAKMIMIVANGERLLNRVWSAASDGDLQEARFIYPKALMVFEQAHHQYQENYDILARCSNFQALPGG